MQKEGKTTNVPLIESIPTIEPPKQDEEYENFEEVSQSDDYDKLDATIVERFDDFMKSTDDKKETKPSEPVINIDNDSLVVGDVTDDEFYDDFFHDDNEQKNCKNAIFLFNYILYLVNSSAIIKLTTKDISCYVNIKTASVYVTVYHLLGKLPYKLIFIMNIL